MKTITISKWKLYLYVLIIMLCTSIISISAYQYWPEWINRPNYSVKLAHIYLDASSFPTLLQMLDLVQNQPKGPKLISWQRVVDTQPITKEIKDAKIVKHVPYRLREYWHDLRNDLQSFLTKYPNAQLIVHVNKDQNPLVHTALHVIPKKRIKELHLYEEYFGNTAPAVIPTYPLKDALRILHAPFPPSHRGPNLAFSVLEEYPQAIIHLALPEMAMRGPHADLLRHAMRLEEVNYEKIAQQLTKRQKKKLLKLNGVTQDTLKYFDTGKPTILYTSTFMDGNRTEDEKQIKVLQELLSGKSKWITNPDQYTWLYKGHPWHAKDTFLQDTIQANWPFVHQLPKQIPIEVFFLTGYMPSKVFGYSSALFFGLPADHILFFIRRQRDPYVPILKELNKITDNQIVKLDDFNVSK